MRRNQKYQTYNSVKYLKRKIKNRYNSIHAGFYLNNYLKRIQHRISVQQNSHSM